MISNLSSFIAYFYVTGRPSIHLCPPPTRHAVRFATLSGPFGVRYDRDVDARFMREPEENGGLSVYDRPGLTAAVGRALADPDCCRVRSRDWMHRYVHKPDGATSARLVAMLTAFVRHAAPLDQPAPFDGTTPS